MYLNRRQNEVPYTSSKFSAMSNEEETDVGQLWFCLMYITPDLFNNTNKTLEFITDELRKFL